MLLELLSLPFLVVANSTICINSIVLVGLLLILGFVQSSLLSLVDWVHNQLDILSPQCILACGIPVGSSHRSIWLHTWLIWCLSLLILVAGRLNSGGYHFGSVGLFVCLFVWVSFVLSCFSDSGHRVAPLSNPFTGPLLEDLLALSLTFTWTLVSCSSSSSPEHL